MTNNQPPPPQSSVPVTERNDGPRGFTMGGVEGALAGDTTMAMVVYVLYLVGLATALAAIIGVLIEFSQRDKSSAFFVLKSKRSGVGLLVDLAANLGR